MSVKVLFHPINFKMDGVCIAYPGRQATHAETTSFVKLFLFSLQHFASLPSGSTSQIRSGLRENNLVFWGSPLFSPGCSIVNDYPVNGETKNSYGNICGTITEFIKTYTMTELETQIFSNRSSDALMVSQIGLHPAKGGPPDVVEIRIISEVSRVNATPHFFISWLSIHKQKSFAK